jgi:hypothetical protein
LRRAGLFRHIINDLRFVTLVAIVSLTAMICVYTRAASKEPGGEATAQAAGARRAPQRQTRRRQQPAARPRVDYSNFSHATKGHFENCASCHLIPSFEKPDIADYPDHPSCINCHRQQFFRGARPVICSNCHTVTAPRSEARFKFPKVNEASQFTDIFPHSKHVETPTCSYCHKVDNTAQTPQANAPKDAFVAPAGTFMRTPTSHLSCFGCHWQKGVKDREQPPLANECSRCHQNLAKPLVQTAALTTALNATIAGGANEPKFIPAVAQGVSPNASQGTLAAHKTLTPPRISPKFVHEIESHKKKTNEEGKEVAITCVECHTAAQKAATLKAMRLKVNQVQLMPSCSTSACHTAISGTAQLKNSVFRELRERGKDAKFDCAICHTPPVSLNPEVPCSHYKAVLESAKKENEALVKAEKKPRGLTGIEALIPPRCAEPPKKEGS